MNKPMSVVLKIMSLAFGVWIAGMIGVTGCSSEAQQEKEGVEQGGSAALGEIDHVGEHPLPTVLHKGEKLFTTFCAGCHGIRGSGSSQGPPLVHKIYEPSHHGDQAFIRAAANGVRAHHWNFGNMPKISGVTSADVNDIVKYIRWLQRQAGIS